MILLPYRHHVLSAGLKPQKRCCRSAITNTSTSICLGVAFSHDEAGRFRLSVSKQRREAASTRLSVKHVASILRDPVSCTAQRVSRKFSRFSRTFPSVLGERIARGGNHQSVRYRRVNARAVAVGPFPTGDALIVAVKCAVFGGLFLYNSL